MAFNLEDIHFHSLRDEDASKLFQQVRPAMPNNMVSKILSFLMKDKKGPCSFCVDVGCGTGLSTVKIAKEMPPDSKVIGIDISDFQIREANRQLKPTEAERISYSVVDANKELPYGDNEVDLITCVQTAHWLNTTEFFKHCDRVLRPGGVLAIAGYRLCHPDLPGASPELNRKMDTLLDELQTQLESSGFWPGRRELLQQYKDITLPYEDQLVIRGEKSFRTFRQTTLGEFFGYVETWSALRSFRTQNPHSELFQEFKEKSETPTRRNTLS